MANVVEIIFKSVDQASGPVNKLGKGLNAAVKELTGFSLGTIASVGGLVALGKGLLDNNKKFVEYNKTIREMTQVTGLGSEEISRIVQVGDDWGISIDQIRTALSYMNRQGVTPSIDLLAQLADQYVVATDKSKWAADNAKLLGRNYQTLIPIFALGGEKLKEYYGAVDSGLVATDKTIKQARELEVAQDNLNDSVTALKNELAMGLVPVETEVVNALKMGVEIGKEFGTIIDLIAQKMRDGNKATQAHTDSVYEWYTLEKKMGVELPNTTNEVEQYWQAIHRAKTNTEEITVATISASESTQQFSTQLLYNKAVVDLDAKAALELGRSMGLVDERTVALYSSLDLLRERYDTNKDGLIDATEAANGYSAAVLTLNNRLNSLPSNIPININVSTTYTPPTGYNPSSPYNGIPAIPKASGGPVFPGGSYLVGEAGPELLHMGTSGGMVQPITNNNYNLTIHSQAQSENLRADFALMQALG